MMNLFGIAGGMLLCADLWAVVRTLRSDAPGRAKAGWVAVVLLIPIVGVLLWMFFGPS